MLQRIYGVAFRSKDQLDDYFEFLREAEERNHRRLGKQLKLFMFSEEAPVCHSIYLMVNSFEIKWKVS